MYRILPVQVHHENVCQLHSSALTSWKDYKVQTQQETVLVRCSAHPIIFPGNIRRRLWLTNISDTLF